MIRLRIVHLMIAWWMLQMPAFTQQVVNPKCPLPALLNEIEKKLNVRFAYDASALASILIDSTRIQDNPDKWLEELLKDKQFECQRLSDKQYLIRTHSLKDIAGISNQFTLSGSVRDAWTGDYLENVAVFTTDLRHGTTTDSLGRFRLSCSNYSTQIAFQMLGYTDLRVDQQQLTPNFSISLIPQIQEMPEVLIATKPPPIGYRSNSSAIQWRPNELLAMGLGGMQSDVLRSMQWLPGVNTGDDLNALPGVRSNEPDQNLILLNDMPLLKVDHYFGIFSALPPNLIQDVTWYRSYFPANYGGRTASIINLNTLEPSLQNPGWSGQFTWDNLSASGVARGPLSKHLFATIAGRSTYYNLSSDGLFNFLYEKPTEDYFEYPDENPIRNTLNIRETQPSFQFYDGYAGIEGHWKNTSLRIQYFTGFDDFDNLSSNGFAIPTRDEHILYRSALSEQNTWQNQAAGLYLDHRFTSGLVWKNWINYTAYSNQSVNRLNLDRIEGFQYPPVNLDVYDSFYNTSSIAEIQSELDWTLKPDHLFKIGLQTSQLNNLVDFDLEALPSLNVTLGGKTVQTYGEYVFENNGWKMESGLRGIYYTVTNQVQFEPRWYLQYESKSGHRFHLAAGNYHQYLRSSNHEDRYNRSFEFFILADDERFPVLGSWQFTGGWTWQKNNIRLEAEAFYHSLDGWLEYAQEMPGVNSQTPVRSSTFRLYDGAAKQFGIDVLLRHDATHWPGWIAYTLSKAEQSIPEINRGAYYPSQNDRRHQLKIVQEYQNNRWSLWMGYQYVSGRPYLNILSVGETLRRDINIRRAYDYLPAYQRFDLGATYRLPVKNTQLVFSAGVYNLFNHNNVEYRQYVLSLEGAPNTNLPNQNYILGNDVSLLPITPYLSVSWKF